MRRDPRVRSWERVRVERRQRAVAQLWRLRRERMTRTAGTFHGTRATAYGDMQSGPELSDPSRVLLALVLFVAVAAVTLLCLAIAGPDVLRAIRPLPAMQRRDRFVLRGIAAPCGADPQCAGWRAGRATPTRSTPSGQPTTDFSFGDVRTM